MLAAFGLLAALVVLVPPAQVQAAGEELLSATLTVGKHSSNEWYGLGEGSYGTIAPTSFTHDGTTYSIENVISTQGVSKTLFFSVSHPLGFRNAMTLTVGDRTFSGSAATTKLRARHRITIST